MLENDAPIDQDRRNTEHKLWLAMQAAHIEYNDATAALDALTREARDGVPSRDGNPAIERAAVGQRTAFENYIEARLQFSEYLLGRPDPGRLSAGNSHTGWPWAFTTSRLARVAVALALLCPTAFSLAYLAHQRNQVRDLNVARDEMSATLDQARNQIQILARKLDAANATQQFAIHQSCGTPAATAHPQRAESGHWRRLQTPPSKPNKQVLSTRKGGDTGLHRKVNWTGADRGGPIARNHQELVQLEKRGERNYYEFALTPSTHFERIGPLGLSVRKVDLKHKYFDLSMMVGDFKLDKNHVNLYEPVKINLSGQPAPVELVANRIDKNHVQGYLSEPKSKSVNWRRASYD